MLWRRALAMLCCLAASVAQAQDVLLGRILPPYPDGLQEFAGTCLSDSSDVARVCDYGIAVLGRQDEGGQEPDLLHVVAQRNLPHVGNQPRWEVTDALAYPQVEPEYFLQVSTCRIDGNEDSQVAALARHDDESMYLNDIVWARRLDFSSGRLLEVDPERVDCLNESLGV